MKKLEESNRKDKRDSSSHSFSNSKKKADIDSIMNSIKYLQEKVSSIPIHLQHRERKVMSAASKYQHKCCSSNSKYTPKSKKESCKDQSLKTIRKDSGEQKSQLRGIKTSSKTDCLKKFDTSPLKFPNSYFGYEGMPESSLMQDFVSLQLQNLRLEKQNLYLEKQLVEQSLLMERRQKQLLKSKLKRMKTYQIVNKSEKKAEKSVNRQSRGPIISQFDISPVIIKIPEPSEAYQTKKKEKQRNLKQIESFKNNDNDIDSLLLSDQNENDEKEIFNKKIENTLEQQLGNLLTEFERKQNKQSIREALGDIANCLKMNQGNKLK